MNTILAICCQLAFLYAYCLPVWGTVQDSWLLTEITIRSNPLVFEKTYNQAYLTLEDFAFYVLADHNNDGQIGYISRFEIGEFNSFIDDAVFVITKGEPRQSTSTIRLKFARRTDLEHLAALVFATTPDRAAYKFLDSFKIVKISEADQFGNHKFTACSIGDVWNIHFVVYALLDENNNETEIRRFMIFGGTEYKQFVVFDRNEFNIIRGETRNRFVLAVKAPGNFRESAYFGLMLNLENNAHENFANVISEYASSDIEVPDNLKSFADYL